MKEEIYQLANGIIVRRRSYHTKQITVEKNIEADELLLEKWPAHAVPILNLGVL